MSYHFDPINILNSSNAEGVGTGGSLTLNGGASIGKNLFVGGNLAISGTTTTFTDNIIVLNNNATSSVDSGILMGRYSSDISNNNNYSGVIYSESTDEFVFGYITSDPERNNTSVNSLIPLRAYGLRLTGGNLNVSTGAHTIGNIWVTTGGNVGIGIANPVSTLQVNGTGIISTSLTTGALYGLNSVITNMSSSTINLSGNMNIGGTLNVVNITSTNLVDTNVSAGIVCVSSNLSAIGTSNTLGNIFTTGGNVGIGTTKPSYALHVSGNIYATGDITAFSDSRLKTDVETITDALDLVEGMRGVRYTSLVTNERSVGVIAQEIEQVLPEVVQHKGEYRGVSYGNITGVLIEAVKQLSQRVRDLETHHKQ